MVSRPPTKAACRLRLSAADNGTNGKIKEQGTLLCRCTGTRRKTARAQGAADGATRRIRERPQSGNKESRAHRPVCPAVCGQAAMTLAQRKRTPAGFAGLSLMGNPLKKPAFAGFFSGGNILFRRGYAVLIRTSVSCYAGRRAQYRRSIAQRTGTGRCRSRRSEAGTDYWRS